MAYKSSYPGKRRKNESKLSGHTEALLGMHNEGYSMSMMQEYLMSFEININKTTIWRYIKKRITRQAGQSNLNTQIRTSFVTVNYVESLETSNYQKNFTDNSSQKSTLEKLNDLSNAENEF